ncbi:DUF4174 domain-containing protein [Paracidovorax citrulli]|uniref:DUF4174 domain-containing protein n=2 Tax=Paracidovorax citrulli TaxID=80869 RepID=A1TU76_PARC0|nr:DUF4174 domain-containing protein [Paracidovorax citrulli]ABM34514.1 conserved hypothetical protein [Paracidovorax citrulli AAC00-1]ATG93972.1 DUF4174 domain-containing protein [Paracidovorax citrulli]PVY63955.1 uncharacterized protein DUF4174 [Paracidovorax citrulli]QCX09925.1 hypothetical protein APS58_1011 [Paracidovorax citrulli]REG67083.1 uncharacterized protein DUF4174 [Paracidovorax citrulli]
MRPHRRSLYRAAALALSLAVPLHAALASESGNANPLTAERWQTRPVVVVVPRENDPLLAKVRAALREPAMREGFRERDMALFTVVDGQGSRNGEPLGTARTAALLKALDVDARGPATFILVGKDGGVKMKEGADVDLQAVFAEIDRMPMRQRR